MAAAAQPVRQTVRCPNGKCRLNQFVTVNGLCRRCTEPLFPKVVEPPKAEVIEIRSRRLMPPVVEMADTIRFLRRINGVSQRQLAERMKVPRTYLTKLEHEKCSPNLATLPKLAGAFNLSVHQLVMLATL
jgi:DNA-binding XRE family transcriptional regulator